MSKNKLRIIEENDFLSKFLHTNVGQNWYAENSIIQTIKHEAPDFLLKNNNNETLALEITQFIAGNKNLHYSQALTRIGNQLCKEIKKNITLKYQSLLINMTKENLVLTGMIMLI